MYILSGHSCCHLLDVNCHPHRSAYGVLIIIMGNSHSRRNSTGLPKAPVRKPSDSDVKIRVIDELGSVRPPVENADGQPIQKSIPYPVSTAAPLYIYIIM